MDHSVYRTLFVAGAAAALAATGPAFAADEETAAEKAMTQEQPTADVGRASISAPEWEYYDQLATRYGPLAWLTFGEVVGQPVADQQGQSVGKIVGLVRAKSDGMFYAVMDVEDAAAAGKQAVAVPVDHLEVVGDEQSKRIVFAGEQALDAMAAYDPAEHEVTESFE